MSKNNKTKLKYKNIKLADVKKGDRFTGFRSWGCVPENAIRIAHKDESGLYVK